VAECCLAVARRGIGQNRLSQYCMYHEAPAVAPRNVSVRVVNL
jgi:hypothetical protein